MTGLMLCAIRTGLLTRIDIVTHWANFLALTDMVLAWVLTLHILLTKLAWRREFMQQLDSGLH